MTWNLNFVNPVGETIRESSEKVDIGGLKEQYQEMFRAAVSAAENLIPIDESVDGDLTINLSGYTAPREDGTEFRTINVTVIGVAPYVESVPDVSGYPEP